MATNIWTLQPDLDNNWLEKLNEWAQRFNGTIEWEETQSTTEEKVILWHATPTIRGVRMADYTGQGSSKQAAKNHAAQLLSDNGKL
ncbi:hypothetical protein FRC11_000369, partial [Ceratobasidium sp. 423]